jgi:hypothetical protein
MFDFLVSYILISCDNYIRTNAIVVDAPPSSLMDSTASPNVKTTEGGVGAHSLVRSTLGVEGCTRALGWD